MYQNFFYCLLIFFASVSSQDTAADSSENTGSYLNTVASDFTKSVIDLMIGEDTTDISISANDDPTKAVEEEDDNVDEAQSIDDLVQTTVIPEEQPQEPPVTNESISSNEESSSNELSLSTPFPQTTEESTLPNEVSTTESPLTSYPISTNESSLSTTSTENSSFSTEASTEESPVAPTTAYLPTATPFSTSSAATASTTSSTTASTTGATTTEAGETTTTSHAGKEKSGKTLELGVLGGIFAGLALMVAAVLFYLWRRKKRFAHTVPATSSPLPDVKIVTVS